MWNSKRYVEEIIGPSEVSQNNYLSPMFQNHLHPKYRETFKDSSNKISNAGAMVTWDAIDEKDTDWLLNDATEPSLEYMSWGVWAQQEITQVLALHFNII